MTRLKRDPAVELARILGCLIVIGCHCHLPYAGTDGGFDFGRAYLACLFADGVAVFWLIMGFYYFGGSADYGERLKRMWKKICIPMLVAGFVSFYTEGWLNHGLTWKESLLLPGSAYLELLEKLIRWENPFRADGPLWYLFIYIPLVCCYPLLKGFAKWLEEKTHRKTYTFLIFAGMLTLNDCTDNTLLEFSQHAVTGLIPAAIMMLAGYCFWNIRERFRGKRWLLLAPVICLAANALRLWILSRRGTDWILYWFSAFGLLTACCVVVFCQNLRFSDRMGDRVNRLASYTFPIYLIHIMVKNLLVRQGFTAWLDRSLVPLPLSAVWYVLILIALVFCISFLICIIIRRIKEALNQSKCTD